MNTGDTPISEQSTVWSRFWSWLSPAKVASVAPSSAEVSGEVVPSAPEVAPSAEVPSAPEVAPSAEVPAQPLQSGRSLEIPLDTKPLDVQTYVEQPDKNDKHEEQPNPGASSSKSHQKKKKRPLLRPSSSSRKSLMMATVAPTVVLGRLRWPT